MPFATITGNALAELNKGLRKDFDDSVNKMETPKNLETLIGSKIPTNTTITEIEVGADIGGIVEWDQINGRTINKLGLTTKDFKIKPFELTYQLTEQEIREDRLGVARNKVKSIPKAFQRKYKQEALEVIAGTHSDTESYDGAVLYGDHNQVKFDKSSGTYVASGKTVRNTVNTGETIDLDISGISEVKSRMITYENAFSEQLIDEDLIDTLIVSPKLLGTAEAVINTKEIAGVGNPHYKKYNIISNSKLSDNEWVLMASEYSPVTMVELQRGVRFRTDESELFDKGIYKYGADHEFVIGTGLYQGVFKAVTS